jgi:DNA mismatch repair protein MutL
LLVEYDGRLFAVDQHAAHERILYNKTLEKQILKQELLVPIPFDTEDEADDRFLEAHRGELDRLGICIRGGGGAWRIEALPALWRAGDRETVKAVLDLKNAGENIAERWAATLACHSALRDGDMLDGESARRFLEEALSLPVQCCPHGRPFVAEIKKEELLRSVRRL